MLTKRKIYIELTRRRVEEIKKLIGSWSYGTKTFMQARIYQFTAPSAFTVFFKKVFQFLLGIFTRKEKFAVLKNPDILTSWEKRFELSGESDPLSAWNKILEKEIDEKDRLYFLSELKKELKDVHIPFELRPIFEKIFHAHIKKEYISDPSVPRAPLVLITGTSGSGKSVTIEETIDQVIFGCDLELELDLQQEKDSSLDDHPVWTTLEEVNPELALKIEKKKRRRLNKFLFSVPLIRGVLKKYISKNINEFDEQELNVDYSVITPNDYQTAYVGEPGNYLKKAFGNPRLSCIRHLEEAHSAFGKVNNGQNETGSQQRTLIDSSNIILDEIISGKRDCLLIASTDQPERIDPAIYRRFVEKGVIIDISEFWNNSDNLREIVQVELLRHDIHVGDENDKHDTVISTEDVKKAVKLIVKIFKEKALRITPSYVRKLVHSIIEIKENFDPVYLENNLLVRNAFKLVAQNAYGDLFNKAVGRMDRTVNWESYIGSVKDKMSEMSNNCLYYGVDEEKGVVLNGPPGSGKTFLVRCWLSENPDVHDISVNANVLIDPSNPHDGHVKNLENIYDIAKMIAPSVIFFDEADALVPKRQNTGSPSDKLTNKFLNLIDGEIPLSKVFTVLTTNRIDIMDPALIRSKRLKVLDVSGHLRESDIVDIVEKILADIPLAQELTVKSIVQAAQTMSNTPADYSAFVEKALSLRNTEFIVLKKLLEYDDTSEDLDNFVKLNHKTIIGVLETANAPLAMKSAVKQGHEGLQQEFENIKHLVEDIKELERYPLSKTHIVGAKEDISENPVNKGKIQLDSFLESELSQEPQVGFIIGVGANDFSGVLLPIATSLGYKLNSDKVMVTGAVSSASSGGAEMEMAVKMTKQSSYEALTLVSNYLQNLMPERSITRILGEFLHDYTIHHQLLSASYNVGGPSAGYALAINTISAILSIPVYNDFGITGAPWIKGVTKNDVGGSVIIGGHKKKTEKVLSHLRRMYMPSPNYNDLGGEFLESYWARGKDILSVTSFGDLIPEVLWINKKCDALLQEMVTARITKAYNEYHNIENPPGMEERISEIRRVLREELEKKIRWNLLAIRDHLGNLKKDKYINHELLYSNFEEGVCEHS